MTADQCKYDLQWQPMLLGTTKEERMNKARKIRSMKQIKREEHVLFLQSMLFLSLGTFCGVGLILIGACL